MSNNLLADIREVLDTHDSRCIPTTDLLHLLQQDPEMGWDRYNRGTPLSARQLAKNLSSYGIRSKTVRAGMHTPKGYEVREFDEAFKRYLPLPDPTSAPIPEDEQELVSETLEPFSPPAPPGTVEGAEELFKHRLNFTDVFHARPVLGCVGAAALIEYFLGATRYEHFPCI